MYPKLIKIEDEDKDFLYRPGFDKNEYIVHLVEDPKVTCTFVFDHINQSFETKRNGVGMLSGFIGKQIFMNEYADMTNS